MYKCDHCRKNITNKRHVRIVLGFTSGWMVPPYFGGKPTVSMADRKPERHFCQPECVAAYFVETLYAIGTNTGGDEGKNCITSVGRKVLAAIGTARPRVQRKDNVGARHIVREQTGE